VAALQDGIHRPIRELKGFQKVFLQPGESKTVTFQLEDRSFALWQDGWKIPTGIYHIQVADLTAALEIAGEEVAIPAWQAGSWYETCQGKPTQAGWETMLGKPYTPTVLKKGNFTMDNTVLEMKDYALVMKIMYKAIESVIAKGFGGKKDYSNPEFKMMINATIGGPLRSMQISGGIKGGIMPGLLEIANGHFFRGIWKMIKG
jgi:beta-glucosidase